MILINKDKDSTFPPVTIRHKITPDFLYRLLRELTNWSGKNLRSLTYQDLVRFCEDHKCTKCGYVFINKVELLSHHAIRIFDGKEITQYDEDIIDLDEIIPILNKHKS